MISYLSKARPTKFRGVALVRLDFNTEDEWRMEASLPTLRLLLGRGMSIVVMSHRGRPKGFDKKLSLKKDAKRLSKYLKRNVRFIPHFRFGEIKQMIAASPAGSVFVLENLRFLLGEERNSKALGKTLATLGNIYVNDAFAVSHRDDASVDAITRFLPKYAGLELEAELTHLSRAMRKPKRPLVLILGGGKAHDKLGVIRYFAKKAHAILVGGASGNTILKFRGIEVGNSRVDAEAADRPMLKKFAKFPKIVTPIDSRELKTAMVDIGPRTEKLFANYISRARTVIWSGPMGVIEEKRF